MASTETFYKQNRLRQFRAFCQTAQTGSISRAARRLSLSQPSVSLQIQALEKEFDTRLFERHGPRIKLTSSGRILLEMAQPLVEGMEKLSESFAARLGRLDAGTLDIAAGEFSSHYLLPGVIKQFSETHERINLRLHNVSTEQSLNLLYNNEADFAVGSLLEVPEDVEYHPVFSYRPVLITPKDHPLAVLENAAPSNISPYGLIRPAQPSATWRVVEQVFKQYGAPYSVKLEAAGWETIKEYVELGLGVAIVTGACLRGDESLSVVPLSSAFPQRNYGLILRRGKFLSPQARDFMQIMAPDLFKRASSGANGSGLVANGAAHRSVPVSSTHVTASASAN